MAKTSQTKKVDLKRRQQSRLITPTDLKRAGIREIVGGIAIVLVVFVGLASFAVKRLRPSALGAPATEF